MSKLMYAVAYNSKGKYKTRINGANTLAYKTWRSMIRRCYCPKVQARRPTYIGCSVSDEWLDFQHFVEWFEAHEYSNHGYELDKDLLLPGNKIYAPSTVCFVPSQLNNLLLGHGAARGQYKQGVCLPKSSLKFKANIKIDGKKQHLGYFDTEQEAYQVYKKAKEANVKRMANHWKNDIADEVYHALMQWTLDDK